MGALEDCIERTRTYALERQQFKRPLASFQLVQKKLVDAQTEVALGLQASLQVGRLKDQGQLAPEMISMVKRNNCGKALQQSRIILDILGGNACADECVFIILPVPLLLFFKTHFSRKIDTTSDVMSPICKSLTPMKEQM